VRFEQFLEIYQDTPLIESSTFSLTGEDPGQLRSRVSHWQRKGRLPRFSGDLDFLEDPQEAELLTEANLRDLLMNC